jgi:hypothetical protein
VDVAGNQNRQIVRSHSPMLMAPGKWGFERRVEFLWVEGA